MNYDAHTNYSTHAHALAVFKYDLLTNGFVHLTLDVMINIDLNHQYFTRPLVNKSYLGGLCYFYFIY